MEIEADTIEEAEKLANEMIDNREVYSCFVVADLDLVVDKVVESQR